MNARRFALSLLLLAALIGAQLALVAHGIEHALHDHDEACIECLSLPGMHAVPKPSVRLSLTWAGPEVGDDLVPQAPSVATHPAFQSRAPPLHRY